MGPEIAVTDRASKSHRAGPRVSVIMPAYNRERFVGEAVGSVLEQTMGDLELIVVDDGSQDATVRAAGAAGDPRVIVLRQPHAGISAAMNRGLSVARGALIARLDSDDMWLPDMLERTVGTLDSRSDVDVVYGRGRAMDEDGAPLPSIWGDPPRFSDDFFASLLYTDCACNVTVVARRECFVESRYDESLSTSEDLDMWVR